MYEVADDLEADLVKTVPTSEQVNKWISATLLGIDYEKPLEINIKVVNVDESRSLNHCYRQKDKATNVLSFPSDLPDFVPSDLVGDLAICAHIVHKESIEQDKALHDHWAHMCIHGVLHLLGYDHINSKDADEMEKLEKNILTQLGIDDPYRDG